MSKIKILIKSILSTIARLILSVLSIIGLPSIVVIHIFFKNTSNKLLNTGPSVWGLYPHVSITFGIILVTFISLSVFFPDIMKIVIPVIVLLTGVIAWSVKRTLKAMEARARIIILESLSMHKKLSREELKILVRQHSKLFESFASLYSEALDSLLLEDKIKLEDGYYKIN